MKKLSTTIVAVMLLVAASTFAQENINREILPVIPPEPATYTELDARNTTPPPRFELKAPKNAPNVVIVLIDDLGLKPIATIFPTGIDSFKSLIPVNSQILRIIFFGPVLNGANRSQYDSG